ncbi:MAG: NUDIX domain-containing protein [Deltaproteobacteria bacterium]|nr:NUDIX domain-containing protein [Deltaproteobacteria bacterium]
MTIEFYDKGYSTDVNFSVIISKDENGYVFVKHKDRETWEIPGGHIEDGETFFEAAKRELMEETGAKTFNLTEVCMYSVNRGDSKSFGSLFFAEITEYSGSLDFETEVVKSFSELPKDLTYPGIQPFLFKEVLSRVLAKPKI